MFGNKKEKEKRFITISEQSMGFETISVIQDVETGVNYMLAQGTGLAVTPLIDKDGKALITMVEQK